MTFEQADNLTERIIAFMRERGGPYTDMPQDHLQWVILSTLSANQFVIRIDREGVRYFACWLWLNDRDMDGIRPIAPERRVRPSAVNTGINLYVAEVVSRGEPGDAVQMIRRIRKRCEAISKNTYWHQPKRNHRFCARWKENK